MLTTLLGLGVLLVTVRASLMTEVARAANADVVQEIEEFEAHETARQQLGVLEEWVEKAEFSKREAQVYDLDMLTDHNTKAIAQKLRMTDGQVRHHRKGYRDKLRTVRAAAGP